VKQIKALGNRGGAGTLIICEVLVMHVDEKIINDQGKIDQQKINHVARLGGNWYAKISSDNLFQLSKPSNNLPMGIDALPECIRNSDRLSGNQLARLASLAEVQKADDHFRDERMGALLLYMKGESLAEKLHDYARELMDDGKIEQAWQVLLGYDQHHKKNKSVPHAV
jgi:hypothetical protein